MWNWRETIVTDILTSWLSCITLRRLYAIFLHDLIRKKDWISELIAEFLTKFSEKCVKKKSFKNKKNILTQNLAVLEVVLNNSKMLFGLKIYGAGLKYVDEIRRFRKRLSKSPRINQNVTEMLNRLKTCTFT